MRLRTVRAQGLIGNEVTAIAVQFDQEDMPAIRQQPGHVASALGINAPRGSALSLIFWEDEAQMLAAEELTASARARLAQDFMAKDPYRNESFEVVYATEVITSDTALVAPQIHLARFEGLTPSTMQRVLDTACRDAETDATERGAEGTIIAVDADGATLAVVSFWETFRDMRQTRRQYTGMIPGVSLPYVDNFELVSADDLERVGPRQLVSSG